MINACIMCVHITWLWCHHRRLSIVGAGLTYAWHQLNAETYFKLHHSILARPYSLKVRGLNSLWYKEYDCSTFRKTALGAKFRLPCLLHPLQNTPHLRLTFDIEDSSEAGRVLDESNGIKTSSLCTIGESILLLECWCGIQILHAQLLRKFAHAQKWIIRHFRRRPCGALCALRVLNALLKGTMGYTWCMTPVYKAPLRECRGRVVIRDPSVIPVTVTLYVESLWGPSPGAIPTTDAGYKHLGRWVGC